MAGKFNKQSRVDRLNYERADANTNWRVGLFKSNVTVDENTVWSDLTECDFSGYSRVTPVFPSATLDGSNNGSSTAPQAVFACNGGGTTNTAYGWFVYDVNTSKLVFSDNFAGPKSMALSGDSVGVTLTALMKQG